MRRTTGSLALVAALALAGCSGGDGRTTGSTGPTGDPTTGAPSGPGSPSVEPATGPTLRLPHTEVRVPADWHVERQLVPSERAAGDGDTSSTISLGEINAFGSTPSPDRLATRWYRSSIYPLKPRKLPSVDVDGVEMYHLSGKVQPLNWLEQYGAVVDDRIVTLSLEFSPEVTPAGRDRIRDAVLATFHWR